MDPQVRWLQCTSDRLRLVLGLTKVEGKNQLQKCPVFHMHVKACTPAACSHTHTPNQLRNVGR